MSAFDYKAFLDSIDRKAYHEGEWQWEEDGFQVTRTYPYSFPGCHNSCGILYYVKDGKVDHVEGDPLDPHTNGKLCMRCLAMPEMLYTENRIKYPMKRAGERGENKWERITWDEALDTVCDYVENEIDAKGYGRESIVVGHGTGRNISWMVPFLAGSCFGTANCGGIYFSGWSCYAPRVCGATASLGEYCLVDSSQCHEDRYANPQWEPAEVLVIWGNEPFKSNADGYIGHHLMPGIQMGAKMISIDPILTWYGARADVWLSVNPGTDAALALALCNVIMEEDLIDHEFVAAWCAYYDEFKDHCKEFTPEWAAPICDLDPEDIRKAARLYANAKSAAIQWGLAFDASTASSMHWTATVVNMMAITGNIDRPGTNILIHNAFNMNPGYATADVYGRPEAVAKKFQKKFVGDKGTDFMGMANPDAMAYALETGNPYPILMFWGQSCNQIAGHEEPAPRAYKYLKEVPFIVYADPVLTPSAVAFADMVLPIAASVERSSIRTWWTPLRAMKKVTQFYEAKSDEEMAIWLGSRLNPKLFGPGKRFEKPEDIADNYIQNGLAYEDENGVIRKPTHQKAQASAADDTSAGTRDYNIIENADTGCPFHTHQELVEAGGHCYDPWDGVYEKYAKGMLRPDGMPGFNTRSGRIELIPTLFASWNVPAYPVYTPVSQNKIDTPEVFEELPYYFINGNRSYEYFHTEHRQSATSREFHPEPILRLSPETAAKHDIKEGDWVWCENYDGRCMQKAHITKEVPGDRFVVAEHGWWKPEEDLSSPHFGGAFDYNPNNLTHAYETGPGGIGCPIKCLPCKIYKVQEGDIMPGVQVAELGGFREYEPLKP